LRVDKVFRRRSAEILRFQPKHKANGVHQVALAAPCRSFIGCSWLVSMLILRCTCDRVLRERTVGPNHRCEVFERPDALMPLIRSV
jgi:hypothetical protein